MRQSHTLERRCPYQSCMLCVQENHVYIKVCINAGTHEPEKHTAAGCTGLARSLSENHCTSCAVLMLEEINPTHKMSVHRDAYMRCSASISDRERKARRKLTSRCRFHRVVLCSETVIVRNYAVL